MVEAEIELGQKGSIGVGIPRAIFYKTGRIKNANSTCLIGKDANVVFGVIIGTGCGLVVMSSIFLMVLKF